MSQSSLTIGQLAAQTGTNVPTIRYYEDIGLLPLARRSANGRRHYRDGDLQRLVFIRRCRDLGFSIEQVRELSSLLEDGDRSCIEVRDLAQMRLDAVRAKLEEMRQLEASLSLFVESCDAACCQGPARNCVIIEDLSASASRKPTGPGGECCVTPTQQAQRSQQGQPSRNEASAAFRQIRRT